MALIPADDERLQPSKTKTYVVVFVVFLVVGVVVVDFVDVVNVVCQ